MTLSDLEADFSCLNALQILFTLLKMKHYTGWPKNWHNFCTPQLYQILTDFQNYFTVRTRRKFVITPSPKIPPHLKCVVTLPCEMSSVLKATTENKTTSVTTHFKKVTTGNNVFIVLVIAKSNCHILQFLHQVFNVSALLLDDALKPATPLIATLVTDRPSVLPV